MKPVVTLIIVAALAGAAYLGWQQMHRPLTTGEKFDNAVDQLNHGTVGGAIDEVKAQTPADRVENAVDRATTGEPLK